jgi:hypothetical protein
VYSRWSKQGPWWNVAKSLPGSPEHPGRVHREGQCSGLRGDGEDNAMQIELGCTLTGMFLGAFTARLGEGGGNGGS